MKQFLYRYMLVVILMSTVGQVKAKIDDCCKNFVPDFLEWFSKLTDQQIAEILGKNVNQISQSVTQEMPDQDLLQHVDPVLLRAYLLHKKGKLPEELYQEVDKLFTDLHSGAFKDDVDEPALRQALTQDFEDVLKRYQAGDLTVDTLQDYIENLYDWWNREDGQEDWGDEEKVQLDPQSQILFDALKRRNK
jgi:hypothetical protein